MESEEEKNSLEDSNRWCIVGAGFAGLSMAATFQQNGTPFVVYERDQMIGGNWQQGTYVIFRAFSHFNNEGMKLVILACI